MSTIGSIKNKTKICLKILSIKWPVRHSPAKHHSNKIQTPSSAILKMTHQFSIKPIKIPIKTMARKDNKLQWIYHTSRTFSQPNHKAINLHMALINLIPINNFHRLFLNPKLGFRTQMLYQELPNLTKASCSFSDKTYPKSIIFTLFSAPGSKAASKIEEKSKKAVSRLSHQFFGKSGNAEENMKSKKKSRQTVASFVLDQKTDLFHPKNQETCLD